MSEVRVRFAPSPTGYLHIGGLRTALFNYLFAQQQGGSFILRVEDTDRTRIVADAVEDITKSLRWMGIEWDEGPDKGGSFGPYVQSERLELYKKYASQLVTEGKAYKCFCTAERLQEMREARTDGSSAYDRHCRDLSQEEVAALEAKNIPYVIRFKVPLDGNTVFHDYLRGEVSFENSVVDDFILQKSDQFPTYHLANVVDDHLMQISHVLRGEEWISSTPKHVLLYQAFGWQAAEFVHLPVILSPKGGKLSKRDGATNVREFIEKGYLEEAMLNFLALLGWSLDGETSMLSMEELKQKFTLDKIGKTSPVFDVAKLDDYNGKYIRAKSVEQLFEATYPLIVAAGLASETDEKAQAYYKSILPLIIERILYLPDVVEASRFFFLETLDYGDGSDLVPKKTTPQDSCKIFTAVAAALQEIEQFNEEQVEQVLRSQVEALGYKVGQLFMAVRIAVTGTKASPGLFETIIVLGKERCVKRLNDAKEVLEG